ncbi:MAG: efflux RND transporter periplasmic adaptor subunit [Azospirillaceae bacterium]
MIAAAVLLLAGLAGIPHARAQDAGAAPPPTVTVAPPLVRELVEWQEFTGQFAAVDTVEVRARVSGYLEQTRFDDGALVAAGDLLFEIDPRPFRADLDAAEARQASAAARLELAERQLARAESLLSTNNIPEATYDERIGEVRVATAALREADAAVARARLDLDYTRIAAPIAGRIGRAEISVGNLVIGGAGGDANRLTTIVSIDPIYFEFDMSESDFLAYQRAAAEGVLPSRRDGGIGVEARLFDEPGNWPYSGVIDFVDNRVDRSSGTIRMRGVFPNPDGFLTPGQFGVLRLPGSPLYAAILLPDSAILSDQDRKIVLTVGEGDIVVPRIVRPGPRELGLRIIRRGLEPDDRVIIEGVMHARPGQPVTPEPGEVVPPDPAG